LKIHPYWSGWDAENIKSKQQIAAISRLSRTQV
jgi:hypothetical protein